MKQYIAGLLLAAALAHSASAGWSHLARKFTRVYEGEIDGKHPVRLTLTRDGSSLTGTYVYTRVNRPLRLRGTIDDTGAFRLDEFDAAGKHTGRLQAEFDGPARLEGDWSKPGGDGEPLHFFAYEAFRKPTDATGPFTGAGTMGGPEEGPGFSLDLYQRGRRIEGFYHAITRNATRLDTDSVVAGTVTGQTAAVRWTSGYSGVSGKAALRLLRGGRLEWRITQAGQGEYWAPEKATLRKAKG
jgi:hypothetical protein